MMYPKIEETENKFPSLDIPETESMVKVTFNKNRRKELHVNGQVVAVFMPFETKYLNRDIVISEDFKTQISDFNVMEG